MAGKTKPMSQIKQLLQLYYRGEKIKKISRILDMSKNTVKAYQEKIDRHHLDINELLMLEDNELKAALHAGSPSFKDTRYDDLKSQLDYYLKELRRVGVTRKLLWEEYRARYPDGYSLSQFYYHLSQHAHSSKGSLPLEHTPGEALFIDFAGKKMNYTDRETGEIIEAAVFVACLPYSDYGFAMAVKSQQMSEFIRALKVCLKALGGVPAVWVPDNLKAAITKPDRYEPSITRAMEDCANHYGATVIPARVRHPQDKALVENQVKLVYQRVFATVRDRQFFSIHEINEVFVERMLKHNQTRMQQKPYCREERFLAKEKPLLLALPEQEFDIKYYCSLKVASNNHIYMGRDKHYYSVPYKYQGKKVEVVYTRNIVEIFADTERIAAHIRSKTQGKYSTDISHLRSTHQHYLKRSPQYYCKLAKDPTLEKLFKLIFEQNKPPEQLYRTCDGLLSLKRKFELQHFKKACQVAIDNRVLSYTFVKNTLANKTFLNQEEEQYKPFPQHNNIRGKGYYTQASINFNIDEQD